MSMKFGTVKVYTEEKCRKPKNENELWSNFNHWTGDH